MGLNAWAAARLAANAPTADPARSARVRRKVAAATWVAPTEGRLMTRLVVDEAPVQAYVDSRRAAGAKGLTPMHVLGAAAARALHASPVANSRVVRGRVVPNDTIAVGFAVDIGNGADLAPVKVDLADTLTPAQIATTVREGVLALRNGADPAFNATARMAELTPVPLMKPLMGFASHVMGGANRAFLGQQGQPLGAVFISNVAPLGVEEVFLAPVPFARASIYIALGTVTERAVVRDGQVVPVRQFTLCITGDHRIVDGVQSAFFFDALLRLLRDPGLLDSPHAAS